MPLDSTLVNAWTVFWYRLTQIYLENGG